MWLTRLGHLDVSSHELRYWTLGRFCHCGTRAIWTSQMSVSDLMVILPITVKRLHIEPLNNLMDWTKWQKHAHQILTQYSFSARGVNTDNDMIFKTSVMFSFLLSATVFWHIIYFLQAILAFSHFIFDSYFLFPTQKPLQALQPCIMEMSLNQS